MTEPSFSKMLKTVLAFFIGVPAASAIDLQFPVACTLNEDCFLQQFVDHDADAGEVSDFQCGRASYDGHKGTDIRLVNMDAMQDGVDVLAAADGTVSAVRDSMLDALKRGADALAAVKGQECGNGLVVTHQDGWVTQYCHLKAGSVRRKHGDRVKAGDVLGQVGASGATQFPHLHMTVRKDGAVVDPFDPNHQEGACTVQEADHLWADDRVAEAASKATRVFEMGFAGQIITLDNLIAGLDAAFQPRPSAPVLIGYMRAMNLRAGDKVSLRLTGPGRFLVESDEVFDRSKAQMMLFTGKRRPDRGFVRGRYRLEVEIERDGLIIHRAAEEMRL